MKGEKSVSYLLGADKARKAVDMVRPAILAAMESGLLKRKDLHIVIMNPCTRPHEVESMEDAILYEESFGDKEKWKDDYEGIAQAKAIASWRTGLPTHVLRETMPYLLQADEDHADTPFWGSAVLHGVVVAASGVQSWFDEWVAYMVAAACRALCIGVMQEEILKDDRRDYIWERELDGDDSDGR
ncbi:MAG: hypothetical protein A2849_01650 [Candidatus Taylorbacteria bacterium RIFCSPHIGHO2_01_FULL_51_15]|uniref:Uncharacterized protein n=1 Tax=Candidatus Taylorbacteria bacterium RIFCSPHIGHO2_01_FULL_51_15 TaxID=1802304 RepID=A0A1G2MA18_9BACT|nr:MAG: hypothetical protein A2849_01650 [Candidatus Taylorbacteria bacterium RIFCSPHIGHO2_01_FULL_51_15]